MSGRLRMFIVATVILAAAFCPSPCGAARWETVHADVSGLNSVAHDNDVEVRVSPGHVVVVASQPVQVKVFTILGQIVCNDTLPAGASRLPLSHGVYIVKASDLTCKIAV